MAIRLDTLTSTMLGLAAGAGVLAFALGASSGDTSASYWNAHGLVIVLGGTIAATTISYRAGQIMTSVRSLATLFRDEPPIEPDIDRLVEVVRHYQRHDV